MKAARTMIGEIVGRLFPPDLEIVSGGPCTVHAAVGE